MAIAHDDESGLWYFHSATEDVLRVGVGKSERKARESATLTQDTVRSPDGKRTLLIGKCRLLPQPLVEIVCEFVGIPEPEFRARR